MTKLLLHAAMIPGSKPRPWETRATRGECAAPVKTVRGVVYSCCLPTPPTDNPVWASYCCEHRERFRSPFSKPFKPPKGKSLIHLTGRNG